MRQYFFFSFRRRVFLLRPLDLSGGVDSYWSICRALGSSDGGGGKRLLLPWERQVLTGKHLLLSLMCDLFSNGPSRLSFAVTLKIYADIMKVEHSVRMNRICPEEPLLTLSRQWCLVAVLPINSASESLSLVFSVNLSTLPIQRLIFPSCRWLRAMNSCKMSQRQGQVPTKLHWNQVHVKKTTSTSTEVHCAILLDWPTERLMNGSFTFFPRHVNKAGSRAGSQTVVQVLLTCQHEILTRT